jgi:adenosine deaminase
LRRSTVEELAASRGIVVPVDLRFHPGMGLAAALARFQFTLALIEEPSAVRRVAGEICEDAAGEGVTTLEIRFAPQLHRGASPELIVDAALDGIAGRAGLILCALYGDAPDLVDHLVTVAAGRDGVVGLDLAGGPNPAQRWSMRDYASAFQRAAALGLGRTVHAGEGRPPDEIRVAVEELGATRIGHGATLLGDPHVLDLVRERAVTIEACPTSNWHTDAIPSQMAHPLARWLDAGVRVCTNTDNTLFCETNAREEHRRALHQNGMDAARLERAIAYGHAAAFRRG